MAFQSWLDLFGRNTDDEAVRSALAGKGISASSLELEKDRTTVLTELTGEGITLVFTDEAILHERDDMQIGEGALVLSEINLVLQNSGKGRAAYEGALPYELQRQNSRGDVRAKLGEVDDEDDDPPWDVWEIDDLVLTVEYSDDQSSLKTVSVELQE